MLSIAKGFTLKRALMMMGGKMSKEDILKINSMLNKIKEIINAYKKPVCYQTGFVMFISILLLCLDLKKFR